jgi:hypothetical protein
MTSGYTMCPYSLHSHVVNNGIYDYKLSHGVVIFAMFWFSDGITW